MALECVMGQSIIVVAGIYAFLFFQSKNSLANKLGAVPFTVTQISLSWIQAKKGLSEQV